GNNDEIFWSASMLKLNLAGIQYAVGDLKADDVVVAHASPAADSQAKAAEVNPAANAGLKALWWNNNSFSGEPVFTNFVTKFNPVLDGPAAPFPATIPPLGPEFVSARFTGTFIPKISGEYKFVSNADDYVALWVNGVEEIAWSGHTAKDRFSAHSLKLVKDIPLDIRMDYRQDKLGYKLTLRLAHEPDGDQSDFGSSVGEFIPTNGAKNQ
ncbi:MAG: PA14 domain-containing protein, partial [Verrucomicrobiota bacterium]